MTKKVLLLGGTGFIGRELGLKLSEMGYEVVLVSRSKNIDPLRMGFRFTHVVYDFNTDNVFPLELLRNIKGIINLMGASVAKFPWTKAYREELYNSRIKTTQNLYSIIQKVKENIQFYIGASGVDIWGDRGDEVLDELTPTTTSNTILGRIVQDWESAHLRFADCGISRVTCLRLGVVLDFYRGGIYEKILPLSRLGGVIKLGSTDQWVSWIALDDVIAAMVHLLNLDQWERVYNFVAPEPSKHRDWMKLIEKTMKVHAWPRISEEMLKIFANEESSMIRTSKRVIPLKLKESGYKFKYPNLDEFHDDLEKWLAGGFYFHFTRQLLPKQNLDAIFPFFKDPYNLEKITPPFLNFKIKSIRPSADITKGTEITYRLSLHGIPLHWVTDIVDWDPPHKFSDNQRKGPYKKWYHTHYFYQKGEDVLMEDLVRFDVPFSPWLDFFSYFYVKSEVQKIFEYRFKILNKLFGKN